MHNACSTVEKEQSIIHMKPIVVLLHFFISNALYRKSDEFIINYIKI